VGVSLLSGKAVLVTGAARGIGAAIAEAVVEEGGAVALLDIDPAGADTAARLASRGQASFHLCDVRSLAQVESAVAAAERLLGPLDGLVNNAGVNAYFDAVGMDEEDWESVFSVDLKAAWMLAKAALPGLIERRGSIVNMSSIHARLTIAGFFPYGAAKAGLEGLTRSLALDYGPAGVRVNAVAPGYTDTHLLREWLELQADEEAVLASVLSRIPLARITEPREIADVVVFLLSERASAITGATIAVDCGLGARFAT
jgi:NAD(P)-dependent dehydrogenase (short-subunit alcohol dehydrogenase family)